MDATDVTIEVFNRCDGSCTGCLLSALERRAAAPSMPPDRFALAADAIAAHGAARGRSYRMVLVFGDIPWLPLETQGLYWRACAERDLRIGATMTFVDDGAEDHYWRSLDLLRRHDAGAVFDITVDPVRLARRPDYAARLRRAVTEAPHLHLAALLSEAVLEAFPPEELASLMAAELPGRPLSLGFTPSLANLARTNYRYDVLSAADYARRFYAADPVQAAHLAAELERFRGDGAYADFLDQTFHVAPGLAVHPVAYTLYGDLILDPRNRGQALGRIDGAPLERLLSGPAARRLDVLNASWLEMGEWGCAACPHRASCRLNGVGLVRRLYRDYENRVGSCYGPRDLDRRGPAPS